jgi:hypothetical protein
VADPCCISSHDRIKSKGLMNTYKEESANY